MTQQIFKKISISALMLGATVGGLNAYCDVSASDETDRPYDGTTARAFKADGSPAWSVEELNALNYKLADERVAKCGNDSICRDQVYWDQLSRDGFYRAMNPFNQKIFLITAVYPEQNKIEMMFHDENQWMKAIGFEERHPYNEAYVAWFDPAEFVYGNGNWIDNAREGIATPGVNVVYAKDLFAHMWEDEGEIDEEYMDGFPPNKFIEVVAPEANLMGDARSRLYFQADNGGIFSTTGVYEYGECLNSPEYNPEVGCHLYYDENYNYFYLPVRTPATPEQYVYIAETDPNQGGEQPEGGDSGAQSGSIDGGTDGEGGTESTGQSESDDNMKSNSSNEQGTASGDTNGNVAEETTTGGAVTLVERLIYSYLEPAATGLASFVTGAGVASSTDNASVEQDKNSSSGDGGEANSTPSYIVDVPVLGESDKGNEKEVIFPWWFVILVLVADVGVMWLLWPKRQKSSKKS